VDFHCSPLTKILMRKDYGVDALKQGYPEADPELVLQGVMWKLRSGVCLKREMTSGEERDWYSKKTMFPNESREKDEEIFSKIQEEADSISRWFIKKQAE